jgi:hypothetical protein
MPCARGTHGALHRAPAPRRFVAKITTLCSQSYNERRKWMLSGGKRLGARTDRRHEKNTEARSGAPVLLE